MKKTVKNIELDVTREAISFVQGNKSAELTKAGLNAAMQLKDVTTTVDLNKDEMVITIRVPKPLQKAAKAGAKIAAKRIVASKAKALKAVTRRVKR